MTSLPQTQLNFKELYERYSGVVCFIVSKRFKNISLIEDAVAAVFIRINKLCGENFLCSDAMRIILLNTRMVLREKLKENNMDFFQVKYSPSASVLMMCMQFGSLEELSSASGKPVNDLRKALVYEIMALRKANNII